jgi:REP element-mobilizing transposase RayT
MLTNRRMSGVRFYRGDLPHWRVPGSCYFVTFRLLEAQPDLGFEERTVVEKALLHFDGDRYRLDAYVVMNDHIHALVRPADGIALEEIIHSWKSFTAFTLQRSSGRRGAVWQREYFDRVVRDESDWMEKMAYIVHNPIKRWPNGEPYRWVHPRN